MVTADRKNGWTTDHAVAAGRCAASKGKDRAHQSRTPMGARGVYENRGGNREIGRIARDFCVGSHVIPAVIR